MEKELEEKEEEEAAEEVEVEELIKNDSIMVQVERPPMSLFESIFN